MEGSHGAEIGRQMRQSARIEAKQKMKLIVSTE